MKLDAALAKTLLLCVSMGMATPWLAAQPAEAPAADAPAGETEITIPGTVLTRANGTFLSLTVEDNAFKLAFYDAEKKQMDADVARATARWDPKYKSGQERRVLNPAGDGKTLVSPPIRPPYHFKLFLVLLSEEGEAVENFVVDFRG